jgi:CRISPR-associated endoribonuclease Cas2
MFWGIIIRLEKREDRVFGNARVCNGYDSVETHHERLLHNLPDNGSVRYLVITEKQYESMEVLVGELKKEEDPITPEQLTLY